MMIRCRNGLAWGLALCLALTSAVCAQPAVNGYRNLLDRHGLPQSATDRSIDILFDAGAWQGYGLPPEGDAGTGFVGPFVHSLGQGRWTGLRFAQLQLHDVITRQPITLLVAEGHAASGYLEQRFSADGLNVRERLIFTDSWHALVAITLTATHDREVRLAVGGRLLAGITKPLQIREHAVVHVLDDAGQKLVTQLYAHGHPAGEASVSSTGYRIALDQPLLLKAHQSVTVHVLQTLVQYSDAKPARVDMASAWAANRKRWAGYLKVADSAHLDGLPDALAQRVAAKAIVTLIGNWRAARGDLHHDGVMPSWSVSYFNGFWAWDSWKHAAALALFAPNLAKDQIRAMFDYQAANGMVPDCIYRDQAENNWRDSKPPLATWAVWQVYRATGDKAFLKGSTPDHVGDLYGYTVFG